MAFEVIENCKKIYNKSVVPDMGVRVTTRSLTRGAKAGGGAVPIHSRNNRQETRPCNQSHPREPQHSPGVWYGCGRWQNPRIGRQCHRRLPQQTGQVGQLFADHQQGNGRWPVCARVSRVRDRQYRSHTACQWPASPFRIQGERANVGG